MSATCSRAPPGPACGLLVAGIRQEFTVSWNKSWEEISYRGKKLIMCILRSMALPVGVVPGVTGDIWLFGDAGIVQRHIVKFLVGTERKKAFELAQVSTACRDGAYAYLGEKLEELVAGVKWQDDYTGKCRDAQGAEGTALFNPPVSPEQIKDWETQHSLTLPSHVRLMLSHVGAAKNASTHGYSVNPANTWRALREWRPKHPPYKVPTVEPGHALRWLMAAGLAWIGLEPNPNLFPVQVSPRHAVTENVW